MPANHHVSSFHTILQVEWVTWEGNGPFDKGGGYLLVCFAGYHVNPVMGVEGSKVERKWKGKRKGKK